MLMNRFITVPASMLLAGAAFAGGGTGELIITEVVDGTLTGGQPKWVEITNVGGAAIADLSVYRFANFNNGGTVNSFDATTLNAVPLAAGASFVIAYENSTNTACDPNMLVSCFEFVYGVPPDQFIGPFTNGDDMYMILLGGGVGTTNGGPGDGSDGLLVDVYGEWGQDGTGEAWEYTDGYSARCFGDSSSVWQICEWFVAGVNSLEDPGGDDTVELMLLQTLTDPFNYAGCAGGACGPVKYCNQPGDTSGCNGTISASSAAMPVSGANDFSVTTNNIPGIVNGLYFVSISNAWTNTAFSGGNLCILPPLGRTTVGNSGGTNGVCDGALSVVLNDPTTAWGMLGASGVEMWTQCYYRDNGAVTGVALGEAMYVEFQ